MLLVCDCLLAIVAVQAMTMMTVCGDVKKKKKKRRS